MRLKSLDVLRCIAILLVLVSHSELPSHLMLAGYVGVDLFFVLSGFLISGLLFVEYKQRQAINFGRFFIRRSLKIYPSYYVLVLVTIIYHFRVHQLVSLKRYIGEIIYVQNYTGPLWRHEWSLAVEEHFYILLPILLLLLIRLAPRRENPFQVVPWAFVFVALACLALRVKTASRFSIQELQDWNNYGYVYAPTHNRLDGLFCGVFLGYLQHFRGNVLQSFFHRKSGIIAAVLLAALLLSPALLLPQRNKLMLTAGLTSVYLGFGILLMLSLHVREILPAFLTKPCAALGSGMAAIGMYSYSIYLWHEPFRVVGFALWLHFFIYLSGTILVGVTFSRLVEYPILKLRDRFLPAMSKTGSARPGKNTLDWQPDRSLVNSPSSD